MIKSIILNSMVATIVLTSIFSASAGGSRVEAAADNQAPVVLTNWTMNFESNVTFYVMTQTQNFNVWAADNVTNTSQLQYRHSENPSFSGVAWVPYTSSQTVNLSISVPDEQTTLYIQVRDQAGNIRTVSINFIFVFGLGCGGPDTQQAVHRFWSDQKQTHFYTSSDSERDYIIANYPQNVWKYEMTAFKILTAGCYTYLPVYRFWSDEKQSHFYTRDPQEAVTVSAKNPSHVWKYEKIAFRDVSPYFSGASKMVHRFWSDEKQSHFYTISDAEKDFVIANYPQHVWKYEGTAFRAIE